MKKKILDEKIIILLIILLTLPIFIAGNYNHPSVDDYCYSYLTYETVQNGGNILEIILAAIETSKTFMQEWQGLYTSAVVLALQPAIFGEKFYAITPFIIAGSLFLGVSRLLKAIYECLFKVKNKKYIMLTWMIVFYLLETIPSTVEGIYWYNGSMNYLFFFSLLLIEISCFIQYLWGAKKGNIGLISVIAFLLSGGNHVTAFAGILISLMFCGYAFYKKQKRLTIVPLIFGMIGFAINLTAPGTLIRSNALNYHGSVIKTIGKTAFQSLVNANEWFNLTLLLFLMGMSILMFDEIKNLKCNIKKVVGITLLQYIVLAGMMAVPQYAMGSFGEPRLKNVLYFSFVLMSLTTFLLFIANVYNQYFANNTIVVSETFTSLLLMAIVLWIGFFGKEYTTTIKSIHQIANGSLSQYSQEMNERVKLYEDEKIEEVVVKELTIKPSLLFFDDITEDKEDWSNKGVEKYYHKKSVVLSGNQENEE